MNRFIKTTLLASVATLLLAGSDVLAQNQNQGGGQRGQRGQRGQGGGNFDPAAMQQRMEERMKENFGVTDDAEWKLLWAKIQKVQEARREVQSTQTSGFGGMMGRRGGGQGQGQDQGGAQ